MVMRGKERPLSPHLTIYKLQISSALSILHRMTGLFLFFAVIVLSWLMVVLLMQSVGLIFVDQDFTYVLNSVIFKLFLLAAVFCLYYHLLNGIRHLFWDIGLGFEIKTMDKSGYLVVALSIIFTGITLALAILGDNG